VPLVITAGSDQGPELPPGPRGGHGHQQRAVSAQGFAFDLGQSPCSRPASSSSFITWGIPAPAFVEISPSTQAAAGLEIADQPEPAGGWFRNRRCRAATHRRCGRSPPGAAAKWWSHPTRHESRLIAVLDRGRVIRSLGRGCSRRWRPPAPRRSGRRSRLSPVFGRHGGAARQGLRPMALEGRTPCGGG